MNRLKNPVKKSRAGRPRPAKKRYRFGLHEILKMLEMNEAKLIIIARNIMKVEDKGGFDEYVIKIVELARKEKIPVIFSMTKYQLGFISLKSGFSTSIIGVMDIHGVIPEVKELEDLVEEKRSEFYESTKPLHYLLKENPFIDQSRLTYDSEE